MNTTDIAIVGMGARFPGAPDLGRFWRTVKDGRVIAGPVPAERWDQRLFYSPNGARDHRKTYVQKMATLDDVRHFDPEFFGISPRRAKVMDPQQRLFLEVVRTALEDAGYAARPLPRARTGVFVGATVSDFMDILTARMRATQFTGGQWGAIEAEATAAADALTEGIVPLQAYSLVGTLMNMVAANVNQAFDLGGPSFTMDAACSSALVALHEAVLHLRVGLCDAAVVGGVYLILTPDNMVAFSRIGALSASDTCRPFDGRADGFVIGEGVGAVLLRRLPDAIAAGDRIHAVIRGVGMNNDGKAEGPMTPRKEGQILSLEAAYADAGLPPTTVELVEAHGTATPVGDATEVAALAEHRGRPGARPTALSSVKANIGHSMSAAGIAGLIRAALALRTRTITPHAGFGVSRPELALVDRGFYIPEAVAPWSDPGDHPRRAGVNSFGFGGTNVHVVLEEAPSAGARRAEVSVSVPAGLDLAGTPPAPDRPELFVLTAPTPALLARTAARLLEALDEAPLSGASLADVAYTLGLRRRDRARAAFVAATPHDLRAHLDALATGAAAPGLFVEEAPREAADRGVAFVFPGQGAQAPGLARDLYERFPRFRAALDERLGGAVRGRALLPALFPSEGGEAEAAAALTETAVCQPVMAGLGLAAAQFLGALGVTPVVRVGHSLGEFAAAAHAGVIGERAAVELVAARGDLISALPLPDRGAMAAVAASRETVEDQIAGLPDVVVANVNHPGQTVISGTTDGVEAAREALAAVGLRSTPLRVSHAFHSPLMQGIAPAFGAALDAVTLAPPAAPVVSAIAVGPFSSDPNEIRERFVEHATAKVDFVGAVRACTAAGARLFVQLAGGDALARMAQSSLVPAEGAAAVGVGLTADKPDGARTFLGALARLFVLGVPLDFAPLFEETGAALAELPPSLLDERPLWPVKDRDAFPAERTQIVLPGASLPATAVAPAPSSPPADAGDGHAPAPLPMEDKKTPPSPAALATAASAPNDVAALAALFREQMTVLEAQAAIIRQQNEILGALGTGASAQPQAAEPVLRARAGAPALGAAPAAAGAPAPAAGPPPSGRDHRSGAAPSTSGGPAHGTNGAANGHAAASNGHSAAHINGAGHVNGAAHINGHSAANGHGAAANGHGAAANGHGAAPSIAKNGHGVDSAAAAPTPSAGALAPKVAELVARIGAFPSGRVNAATKLGADLGFDSLMVVELSAGLAEQFPGLGTLPPSLFHAETTVTDVARAVAETLAKRAGAGSTAGSSEAERGEGAEPNATANALTRYAVIWEERRRLALPANARPAFDGPVLILDEEDRAARGAGLAVALRDELDARGVTAALLSADDLPADETATPAIVDLRPLAAGGDDPAPPLLPLLELCRRLDARPPAAYVVAHGGASGDAVAGFTKALGREWTGSQVKAIDLGGGSDAERAGWLADELLSADAATEVRLSRAGREEPRLVAAPLARKGEPGHARPAGVVTGGARGLGARLALTLAARSQARLLLLGRAPAGTESDALIAAIRADGGDALYISCDVRDAGAVARALAEGRARFGGFEFAVHAAGALEDGPIARKDDAAFRRVVDTKVAGLRALWQALADDPVACVLSLGSWAGRFGSAHQTDYAAANHALGRLAERLAAARPRTRVVTIDLPPWQGSGMVGRLPEAVQQQMKARGIPFLTDQVGLAHLLDELEASPLEAPSGEVVLGAQLAAAPRALAWPRRLSAEVRPWLEDHRIGERIVLPLAAGVGFLLEAAQTLTSGPASAPGAAGTLEELTVAGGITVDRDHLLVTARARTSERSDEPVAVELLAAGGRRIAYKARLGMGEAPQELAAPERGAPPTLSLASFYEAHTFHGPRLQVVDSVDEVGVRHVRGVVRVEGGSPEEALVTGLDGALQVAAFWAVCEHGRAGLPVGAASVRLARPLVSGERLEVLGLLQRDDGGAEFLGDLDARDAAGVVVLQLRGLRAVLQPLGRGDRAVRQADAPLAADQNAVERPSAFEPATTEVPTTHYKVDEFPEVKELHGKLAMAEAMGLTNPYFRTHEGTNGDTALVGGKSFINFSSYNYVGLSGHPEIAAAISAAVQRYGSSVSASRVASGQRPIHEQLERAIARFVGAESAFVMVGGHATNVSVIGHLLGPEDLIVHDSLAHDSILGGAKLSGARRRPFAHNDPEALERILAEVRPGFRRVLVAVEGVYSMDGDIVPLAEMIAIKKKYGALLFVDEAHSLGVIGRTGRGVGEHAGIDPADVDLWMGTLSKSLSSCGGYIAGARSLIDFLRYTVPGFVYSVGISPANAAAALKSLELLEARPELARQLQERARFFLELFRARGIDTGLSVDSAVIPCIVGNSYKCLRLSEALRQRGINVQPIMYPAVEENQARLRFFVTVLHTEEQLQYTADALAEELGRLDAEERGGRPTKATSGTSEREAGTWTT